MQKIPNLRLFVGRDDQLVYFTMFSPHQVVQALGRPIILQGTLIIMKEYVSALITIHEPKTMAKALFNMKVAMMLCNRKWTLSIKIILGHFNFYPMERDPYFQNECIRKKYNTKRKVEKAKIVVRGFEKLHGLDCMETFATVIKWSTIWLVCTLAS